MATPSPTPAVADAPPAEKTVEEDTPETRLKGFMEAFDGEGMAVRAMMTETHRVHCGSRYLLPQTSRIQEEPADPQAPAPPNLALHAAGTVFLESPEVAMARFTVDLIVETMREDDDPASRAALQTALDTMGPARVTPEQRTQVEEALSPARLREDARTMLVEVLGAPRLAAEQARVREMLDGFVLRDPVTQVNLFDAVARGPLYYKYWAASPMAALTQAALDGQRRVFQHLLDGRRGVLHHAVDNVAALCLYFPITDVRSAAELLSIATVLAEQTLHVLRVDAAQHRQMDMDAPGAFSSFVLEYHLAPVYRNVPSLDGKTIHENVPHARLFMSLVPLHVMRMRSRAQQLEEIIISEPQDAEDAAKRTARIRAKFLRDVYWEQKMDMPEDFLVALDGFGLDREPPEPEPEVPADAPEPALAPADATEPALAPVDASPSLPEPPPTLAPEVTC